MCPRRGSYLLVVINFRATPAHASVRLDVDVALAVDGNFPCLANPYRHEPEASFLCLYIRDRVPSSIWIDLVAGKGSYFPVRSEQFEQYTNHSEVTDFSPRGGDSRCS